MERHLVSEFMSGIETYIDYWDDTSRTPRRKMEGLAFSILVMLDGMSGTFRGDINTLAEEGKGIMLHDEFYIKE